MTSDPTTSRRLSILLKVLLGLNIFDTLFTLAMVASKLAQEGNPLMDFFLQRGPMAFFAAKMSLSLAGIFMFWKARRSHWNVIAIVAGLDVCYAALVAYEVLMTLSLME